MRFKKWDIIMRASVLYMVIDELDKSYKLLDYNWHECKLSSYYVDDRWSKPEIKMQYNKDDWWYAYAKNTLLIY